MNDPNPTGRPEFEIPCHDFANRERGLAVRAWRGVVTLHFPPGESASFEGLTELENALSAAGMWSEVVGDEQSSYSAGITPGRSS